MSQKTPQTKPLVLGSGKSPKTYKSAYTKLMKTDGQPTYNATPKSQKRSKKL